MAKKCETAGSPKVQFSDFMLEIWQNIGYAPEEVELASLYDDHGEVSDMPQGEVTFSPPRFKSNPDKFRGVMIRRLPKECDTGMFIEFMLKCGLPQDMTDQVDIKENGKVYIQNIENTLCQTLIKNIHQET